MVRHITLYGHKEGDDFTVHLRITAIKEGHVEVSLCTTEPTPHTRAIAKAYEAMGEEEVTLIFGSVAFGPADFARLVLPAFTPEERMHQSSR